MARMLDRKLARNAKHTAIALITAASLWATGTAQACSDLIVPQQTMALAVRTLQSDLMVSALSCNQRDRYNAFAVKFRPNLKVHGNALKAYFNDLHGKKAKAALNTYVTDLANFAAIRHAEDAKKFCGGADSAFRALLINAEKGDLEQIALAYATRVSPSLKQEIQLAASSNGCEIVDNGETVAVGGVAVLD